MREISLDKYGEKTYNKRMANDVILYRALAEELKDELVGGRVNKIYQPKDNELVLIIKKEREKILFLSASPTYPRIYVTNEKSEFPVSAPSFCMLLRKHLSTSRIERIELYNTDRIIKITFSSTNELRDSKKYYLYYEGLGRYANIVFADENNIILDAVKRMSFGMSTRVLLPGMEYPTQEHTKVKLDDVEKVKNILDNVATATEISDSISGVSTATAKEIFSASDRYGRLLSLLYPKEHNVYAPCVHSANAGVAPTEYSTDTVKAKYRTLSEALDSYYKAVTREENVKENGKEELKILKKVVSKYEKTVKNCKNILENSEKNGENLRIGNLILTYIYMLKKGDKEFSAYDYEKEENVKIVLDPLKSPKENAEAYFKKYKKGKRAAEVAEGMLSDAEYHLEYLKGIKASLGMTLSSAELSEIREELKIYDKTKVKKGVKKTKSAPIYNETYEGFRIYVGKNGIQNDKLTFGITKGGDIWLHVKSAHGSHVIIVTENREVPYSVLYRAAVLALTYSDAASAGKGDVDYTLKKHVKRLGNAPGMVNYVNYKTITVKL